MAFDKLKSRQSESHKSLGPSNSTKPARPPPHDNESLHSRDRQSSIFSTTSSQPSSLSSGTPYLAVPLNWNRTFVYDELDPRLSKGSFDSIVDDPFFLKYNPTPVSDQTKDLSDELAPEPGNDLASSVFRPIDIHDWDIRARDLNAMESINISVIGANGVGKSHFIQRAMSLPRVPGPSATTARINIDNMPYAVTLFELDLEYFDMNPDQPIKWPKQMGGAILPRVDGVLLLYDVMNRESIAELPQTLNALVNSSLPTVLVATKCDNPENVRQINTENLADACQSCLATFKTAASKPESARMALSSLLKSLVMIRQEDDTSEGLGQRRRAASEAHLEAPPEPTHTRPISQQSKHSRASSDMSLVRGFTSTSGMEYRNLSRSPRVEYSGITNLPDNGEDESLHTGPSMFRSSGIRLERAGPNATFLDVEDSDVDSIRHSDDIPILQRNDEMVFERPSKKSGTPFQDLIDRLLAPKMSRSDMNFAEIFLCLYRKFAAPSELLIAILARLERVKDDRSVHYLTKTSTQLRIIEVVAKWVSTYPGDFGRQPTRRKLDDFIGHLALEPIFAAAAQQMRTTLDNNVVEDDDTGWARADAEETESENDQDGPRRAPAGFSESMSTLSVDDSDMRPSASSSLYTDGVQPGKLYQFHSHSYEDYEREAATMVPTYTLPLTKFRYHIFMDTSDGDIADEITRIDWVMLSSIRIRDLVRSVSLPPGEKEKCKSMKNVNRMVEHFNHIAKWVSNMILMRDKSKHRAQMLEKFMNIALKLRVLNNYNGLAAVLAGINGLAVHRLSQTRALIPEQVQKRFARLGLLMGTQKSFFAYRLAWENSPLPRIPFMPLHRRDLVSAEEGSMTFVGGSKDRINWKKFEVLGEILLPIMKSQGSPYPNLSRHDTARELILDCLMPTDDEDIYQRSLQVENPSGSSVDTAKKKFPWFAKS